MAEISFGDILIRAGKQTGGGANKGDFKIAVLGNFAGDKATPAFKRYQVDRDEFDELIAKIKPSLNLSFSIKEDDSIDLSFSDLDDFHPDHLYSEVSLFNKLRNIRKKLQSNDTFAEAAKQVYEWLGTPEEKSEPQEAPQTGQDDAPPQTATMNLDSLIDATIEQTAASGKPESLAQSLISQVIGPYIIPKADPRQEELTEAVDQSVANLMRQILHHPKFLALESTWLSLYSMVREIETDSKLTIEIWNCPIESLEEDLLQSDDLTQSQFYKSTIQETIESAGGKPYNVMLGLYQINNSQQHCSLLGRIGNICAQSETAFLTNADWSLLGLNAPQESIDLDDLSQQLQQDLPIKSEPWQNLRKLIGSQYVGLTFPRYVTRYPYGKKSNPINKFKFEELEADREHSGLAWGYGCVAAGILLADSFSQIGKSFTPGDINHLKKVPTIFVDDDGETVVYPQAELWMHERIAEALSALGLIPLWSIKNEEGIMIRPFNSLHTNRSTLKGSW